MIDENSPEQLAFVYGSEGRYIISNKGTVTKVRNHVTTNVRVFESGGELKVKIGPTSRALHRLLAIAFIPNPKKYTYVVFKDENRLNCKLSNLEWGKRLNAKRPTYSNKGKHHSYTTDKLDVIKRLVKQELSISFIAQTVELNRTTVRNIIKRYGYGKGKGGAISPTPNR